MGHRGLLKLIATRSSTYGLEMHLAMMHKAIALHRPRVVVVDPLTTLLHAGVQIEVNRMLLRLIDYLKCEHVTAFFTSLTAHGGPVEGSDVAISSMMDTWLLLRAVEVAGERNRLFYVLKSRGMAHSNQVREFRLTSHGADLVEVYVGPGEVLTGSARVAQEAREAQEEAIRSEEISAKERVLDGKRAALAAEIARLQAALRADEAELNRLRLGEKDRLRRILDATRAQVERRGGDERPGPEKAPARTEGRP